MQEIKYHFFKSLKTEACTGSRSWQVAEPGNELGQSDSSICSFMPSMYSKTISFARHNAGSIDFDGTAMPLG